jgi:hypothetical protein
MQIDEKTLLKTIRRAVVKQVECNLGYTMHDENDDELCPCRECNISIAVYEAIVEVSK